MYADSALQKNHNMMFKLNVNYIIQKHGISQVAFDAAQMKNCRAVHYTPSGQAGFSKHLESPLARLAVPKTFVKLSIHFWRATDMIFVKTFYLKIYPKKARNSQHF